jgi:hypothetical protein
LTGAGPTLHDGLVRRVLAFALVLLMALSLPLREVGHSAPEPRRAASDASARTDGPTRAIKIVPHVAPASSATSQGRPASETLNAAIWSLAPPDYSFSSSVPAGRFRLLLSPPLRDFPLLI